MTGYVTNMATYVTHPSSGHRGWSVDGEMSYKEPCCLHWLPLEKSMQMAAHPEKHSMLDGETRHSGYWMDG